MMRRVRDERGTAAIELVLIAPVIIVMLLLVIGLGRYAHTRQEVNALAAEAARAASLQRDPALSAGAAQDAATQGLGTAGLSCATLTVNTNLSDYRPGGQIVATVTCTAKLSDVLLAGFPGTKTFTATATVPIETYRGS